MTVEELCKDVNFVVKELPEVVSRLQAQSGISASLCVSLIGQQVAYSLAKSFSSKNIPDTLSELSAILEKNKLGSIITSKDEPYSFELQGCIGCEDGVLHGDSLRCQLLIRIFEACLEERLDTSYVVKWSQVRKSDTDHFNCTFKVRGL